jgi:predicted nucleic acid-binding protein
MPGQVFLDTNVLVYAFGTDKDRKITAEQLLIKGGVIGVQTLNEFVNVANGKLHAPWPTILIWLEAIQKLCAEPVPLTMDVHRQGIRIAEVYGYHFYDSLMLAAALEASCTVFYSEDMQDGQNIGGMTIRNPFSLEKKAAHSGRPDRLKLILPYSARVSSGPRSSLRPPVY